jgi:DNA-directed RNA polymerase omega subunit
MKDIVKDIVALPLRSPGPGVDSKYRLGVLAAQRALQIVKGSQPRVETAYHKATTKSLAEFQEGAVPFVIGEEAVKARMNDEDLYKEILAEARAAYLDEEGNPVFAGPPGSHDVAQVPAPAPPVEAPST